MWLPQIDLQLCNGCSECVTACPTHALGMVESKAVFIQPEACTYCGDCELVCPQEAISLFYIIRKENPGERQK